MEYTVGKNKIYAASFSKKEAKHTTPILFVHGSWGGSFMWNIYVEFFVKSGWNVGVLDLRGHGKSGGSVAGASMQNYVSDMDEAVSGLSFESPILIGHSMAGLLVLMYATQHNVSAVVSIDPSASAEVQKESSDIKYSDEYTIADAGLPKDPMSIMKALPDMMPETLLKMKNMLGNESGIARSERKKGISVPKDKLSAPLLFVGGELGESVEFGIGINGATKMAEYYEGELVEIKGATHPGILMGKHSGEAVEKISDWLNSKS